MQQIFKSIYFTCPHGGAPARESRCKHSLPLSATDCCSRAARSTDSPAPRWWNPKERPPSPVDTQSFNVLRFHSNTNKPLYLLHDPVCHFALIFRLRWLLIRLCGKYGSYSDHREGHVSRSEPNRAERHGPHLDLLEGLGLGRVAGFTDVHVLFLETLWVQLEVLLEFHKYLVTTNWCMEKI